MADAFHPMQYSLEDVTVGYRGRPVVQHINATLREGEFCALVGANGAGKSTLLRTMAAFLPPLGGQLRLGDLDVRKASPLALSRLVGVVLTERVDAMGLTVRELVGMGRSPYTNFWGQMTADDRLCAERAMERVEISHLAGRPASTLSDGERQKAMIAKALAQETPVILLDEPTAFLDFPSKVETTLLLRTLCRDMRKSVLISTHDLDLALQVADSLWLLNGERRLVTGTPHSLGQSGALNEAFRGDHVSFDKDSMSFRIT